MIDISIGHAPERGWQGARSRCGLSEYVYHHDYTRPALEAALTQASIPARFWDAADHPEWRRKRRGNLLLLDRIKAIFGASPKPSILLDLHCNASRNPRYGGFMVIYRQKKDGRVDAKSKRLAGLLCGELAKALPGMKNRGPQGDQGGWVSRNLALPRWSRKRGVAGVIVELGFLTCSKDVALLRAPETPAKVAGAVVKAVQTYQQQKAIA